MRDTLLVSSINSGPGIIQDSMRDTLLVSTASIVVLALLYSMNIWRVLYLANLSFWKFQGYLI